MIVVCAALVGCAVATVFFLLGNACLDNCDSGGGSRAPAGQLVPAYAGLLPMAAYVGALLLGSGLAVALLLLAEVVYGY